jgi:hypothetical protein
METLNKESILKKTHYGLNIYAHILRCYYPEQIVLSISGRTCAPARNPFNSDKPTLFIEVKKNLAVHRDSENAIPAGDVFSYAELHYKQSGDELLQILNVEMNLQISEKFTFYGKNPEGELPKSPSIERIGEASFSFFKAPVSNITPHSQTTLVQIFNAIKGNYYEERTSNLRAFADGKLARLYKAQHFDYCTFSGVFTTRNDKSLVKHSGLLCIDFDHLNSVETLFKSLLQDDYFDTQLLFRSPSGDGLKWIIQINPPLRDLGSFSHGEYFAAVANYIRQAYGVEVDKSGRDLSRACFLPHDPNAYINPLIAK